MAKSETYNEQSAPHSNSEMPKGTKGGNFSKMKSLNTPNPEPKSAPKGGKKDHGQPYGTDNPKGTERANRGDSIGKNKAHGY